MPDQGSLKGVNFSVIWHSILSGKWHPSRFTRATFLPAPLYYFAMLIISLCFAFQEEESWPLSNDFSERPF